MLCYEPPYYDAMCVWWFATETPLPSLPYPVDIHVWDVWDVLCTQTLKEIST